MKKRGIILFTIVLPHNQRQLHKILAHSFSSVLCLDNDSFSIRGAHPDLALISSRRFSDVSCERAILIARTPSDLPVNFSCTHAVAVIDSSNSGLRQAVLSQKLPTLTCGRSGTDTFTLTSLTDDSAVISMSRPICAFDEHTIEPFELPVSFAQPVDSFTLLAASAVFCLLGKQNPLAAKEGSVCLPVAFFTAKFNAFPRKNLQL